MAFFNDFKEMVANAAQSVTSKTKDSVESTRLASESRGIAGEIASLYEKIGKIYVDTFGEDAEAMAPLCARVMELRERLEAVDRQRMQLRNQNRCPSCGSAMPKAARFCSSCGRRMPEPAPEAEPRAEEIKVQYCPECGAMRKDADRFCAVCGFSYVADEPAEPAAPAKPANADNGADAEFPTDYEAE